MMKYILSVVAIVMLAMTGMAYTEDGAASIISALESNGIYGTVVQPTADGNGYTVALPSEDDLAYGLGVLTTVMVAEGVYQNSVIGYITGPGVGIAYVVTPSVASSSYFAVTNDDPQGVIDAYLTITASPKVVQF